MEWIPLFPEGKSKSLTFSYDDGSSHDARLIEILNKYGMKGTFNICSGWCPDEDKLKEKVAGYAGHEIACHGTFHPFLKRMPLSSSLEDMLHDRKCLEKAAGHVIHGMAYPYEVCNPEVVSMLRSAGFVYARTGRANNRFDVPYDFMEWDPTCHHNDATIELADRFLSTYYVFAICYVWGHSAEFNSHQNWDVIEKFCERLAGQKDIWYATNIEIYDYITAVRRLEFSADNRFVRNPSAQTVWLRNVPWKNVIKVPGGTEIELHEEKQ